MSSTYLLGTFNVDGCARTAFRRGARSLNLRGNTRVLYVSWEGDELGDDAEAVRQDWLVVGADMDHSIDMIKYKYGVDHYA